MAQLINGCLVSRLASVRRIAYETVSNVALFAKEHRVRLLLLLLLLVGRGVVVVVVVAVVVVLSALKIMFSVFCSLSLMMTIVVMVRSGVKTLLLMLSVLYAENQSTSGIRHSCVPVLCLELSLRFFFARVVRRKRVPCVLSDSVSPRSRVGLRSLERRVPRFLGSSKCSVLNFACSLHR